MKENVEWMQTDNTDKRKWELKRREIKMYKMNWTKYKSNNKKNK